MNASFAGKAALNALVEQTSKRYVCGRTVVTYQRFGAPSCVHVRGLSIVTFDDTMPLHTSSKDLHFPPPNDDAGAPAPSSTAPASPSASRTRTGLHIRTRALRALDAANASLSSVGGTDNAQSLTNDRRKGSSLPSTPAFDVSSLRQAAHEALNVSPSDAASCSSSTTSRDSACTTTSAPDRMTSLRNKSATFVNGLALAGGCRTSSAEHSPTSVRSNDDGTIRSGTGRRAARLGDTLRLPRRQMSSYTPSYSSKGVNNDEYRKHNLFPLPPPGHIRPILLPAHAVLTAPAGVDREQEEQSTDEGLRIRIDGFVEQWPDRVGTGQRLFMQLARQLANLPRLPRQQPAAQPSSQPSSSSNVDRTPEQTTSDSVHTTSSSGISMPTTPLHADTDDSVFFPEMPYGVPRTPSHAQHEDDHDHEAYGGERERPGDSLARHALALGAPERAIGRVLQGIGALPVEGKVEGEGWTSKFLEETQSAQNDVIATRTQTGDEDQGDHSSNVGPLGGSAFWANRTREEVEKLWRTLEHRLRCFWTYRKPFQDVVVQVTPMFSDQQEADKVNSFDWVLDEYKVPTEESEGSADTTLLAVTDLRSDANGLFSTHLHIPSAKLRHYFHAFHQHDGKSVRDVKALRIRARMTTEGGQVVYTPWQTVDVIDDARHNVHVICDIDDTAKHTHVLGGARAVARNVFARPFEEVVVPGVQAWFARLSVSERNERTTVPPLISGWHYVTNAPAEMHAITKAYLATANLPAGALLLKHYFSARGAGSLTWLQGMMQPASARKKNNLLRCLDDFSASQFILVGDSGEMDLDVYCELARSRPEQVRSIWIRNVGNVSPLAKALVDLRIERQRKAEDERQDAAADTPAGGYASDRHERRSSKDGGKPANTSEDFLVRLQRNLTSLPDSVSFQIWESGYDAIDESVRQVQRLKGLDIE